MRLISRTLRVAALLSAGLASSAPAADLSGMWWITDRSEVARLDHDHLPFTPQGADAYRTNRADIAAGRGLAVERKNRCLPPGLPRLMLARYPFQILQRPEQVTFLHERMHLVRLIYLDKDHPEDPDPSYDGNSIGKWDGDTLVVDTIAFKPNTVLDATGIPHSEKLHLVERFRLRHRGATLIDRVTLDDPVIFTRPVTFDIEFAKHPEVELMEDVCSFGPPMRDTVGPASAGHTR
jgi:hypothetical protein